MDPHDTYKLGAIFFISISAMVSIVGHAWLTRPRATGGDSRQLTDIAERLSRLESAVDAIAVETERISEGQRFTTKLLSDQAGSPASVGRR